VPGQKLSHDESVGEDIEVTSDRRIGNAERTGKCRRIPDLVARFRTRLIGKNPQGGEKIRMPTLKSLLLQQNIQGR
jgi:hypothetical protein